MCKGPGQDEGGIPRNHSCGQEGWKARLEWWASVLGQSQIPEELRHLNFILKAWEALEGLKRGGTSSGLHLKKSTLLARREQTGGREAS